MWVSSIKRTFEPGQAAGPGHRQPPPCGSLGGSRHGRRAASGVNHGTAGAVAGGLERGFHLGQRCRSGCRHPGTAVKANTRHLQRRHTFSMAVLSRGSSCAASPYQAAASRGRGCGRRTSRWCATPAKRSRPRASRRRLAARPEWRGIRSPSPGRRRPWQPPRADELGDVGGRPWHHPGAQTARAPRPVSPGARAAADIGNAAVRRRSRWPPGPRAGSSAPQVGPVGRELELAAAISTVPASGPSAGDADGCARHRRTAAAKPLPAGLKRRQAELDARTQAVDLAVDQTVDLSPGVLHCWCGGNGPRFCQENARRA